MQDISKLIKALMAGDTGGGFLFLYKPAIELPSKEEKDEKLDDVKIQEDFDNPYDMFWDAKSDSGGGGQAPQDAILMDNVGQS